MTAAIQAGTGLALAILLAGCGAESMRSASVTFPGSRASDGAAGGRGEAAADASLPPAATAASAADRRIIYVAEVSLAVEDFPRLEEAVPRVVREFGGYLADATIDRTHGSRRSGRWVARVPVDRFDAFLVAIEDLGVPENRRQTAEDVTEEFVDLEARIASKERLEEWLLKLVDERTGRLADVIEAETQLARVREEIERLQGRLRYLADRTTLTTVTINGRERRDYVPRQAPSLGNRVAHAWGDSLQALRAAGEAAVVASVAAVPWVVLLMPVAWVARWRWRRFRRGGNPT